jgi:hypothetical protein
MELPATQLGASSLAAASDDRARLRWCVYSLLIAISVGQMTGRIFAVNAVDMKRLEEDKIKSVLAEREKLLRSKGHTGDDLAWAMAEETADVTSKIKLQRPFLSANDRSRWAAMRALVEQGSFAIDDIQAEPSWDTIDMVKHRDRSGESHLYSSKPPLLIVLYSIPYWIVYHATGYSLATHPYEIGRAFLVLFNVIPLAGFFVLMARLVERYGRTDWARLFVMATATLATFVTTFAVVLNNHIPAVICVALALYAVLRIWYDERREARYFVVAGLFAALAFVNEMPALAFSAAVGVACLWKAPRPTIAVFAPVAALVAVAYFGANYYAHDSWAPPYMHRSKTDPDDDWYRYTYDRGARKGIVSHWTHPKGIDAGEPSRATYVANVLVGTHGIFSLTPVWLFAVAGVAIWGRAAVPDRRALALFIGSISLVCVTFYLLRPLEDRNYGGMTSGFRWVFWLTPMWLLAMLPALDATAESRRWRIAGAVLLAFSALSAAYPTWNPWVLPWLRTFAIYMGWNELPG